MMAKVVGFENEGLAVCLVASRTSCVGVGDGCIITGGTVRYAGRAQAWLAGFGCNIYIGIYAEDRRVGGRQHQT